MKKKMITVGILSVFAVGMFQPAAEARNIGRINTSINATGEVRTQLHGKVNDTKRGVVNLTEGTNSAWVTASMRNSNNEYRGGVTLRGNERREFAQTSVAAKGFLYKLGLRKTDAGSMTVKGSWSPDV